MVDLPYLELMGNHATDEEKAKKTRKVEIDYNSDERRIMLDPPPLKWSVLRYGFEPEEDRDGEQEAQA
jgi:hypothetical protein